MVEYLIITSGLSVNETVPTEVYNLNNGDLTLLDPYPLNVWGATGGVLQEKYAILCGGLDNNR